jgi:hypothetical protein
MNSTNLQDKQLRISNLIRYIESIQTRQAHTTQRLPS